jgi:phage tail sheath protein FI
MITHCEQMADRFGVLDAMRPGRRPARSSAPKRGRATERSRLRAGLRALYYPWLQVRPPDAATRCWSPHPATVCGIFARSDNSKGVHKAPANELVTARSGSSA